MEGEQKPVVIIDESRVDVRFHIRRLAVELRAKIGSLYGLAVLIFSFIGNFVGLGFPNPRPSDAHTGELCVPRIANRFDLSERVKTVGLGNLFSADGSSFGSRFFGSGRRTLLRA